MYIYDVVLYIMRETKKSGKVRQERLEEECKEITK